MTAKTAISVAWQGASDPVPLRSLHLDRGLAHPIGRAVLDLPGGVTAPEPGQEVALGVAHSGTEVDLMTGFAAHLEAGPRGVRVTVLEHAARLMAPGADESYGATTAGQVIADLCRAAEVPTGALLPGATLPHLVLRSDQTRLDHAKRLAALSGLALTSDTAGQLLTVALTVPVPGAPPSMERAMLERMDSNAERPEVAARVIGSGAMGSKGPGASTLPLADVELISSGAAEAGDLRRVGAIRTLADAALAALAHDQRHAADGGGVTITTPLPEDLSPGDVVLLPDSTGLPLRLSRLEDVRVGFSAQAGLTARYRFSDLEAA